jgi:hypothetical protein
LLRWWATLSEAAMLSLLISLALAPAHAEPLYVPLSDVVLSELVCEDGPSGEESGAPLAWSTLGSYTIGDRYPLRDEVGEVVLVCTLRSMELRAGGEELWATLECPDEATASL